MSFSDCYLHEWEIKSDTSDRGVTMNNPQPRQPKKCIHMKYCGDVVKNFHLLLVGSSTLVTLLSSLL